MTEFGDVSEFAEYLKDHREKVLKRYDLDYVWLNCGPERTSKSTLGIYVGCYCDPDFSVDNICLPVSEYIKMLQRAEYFQSLKLGGNYKGSVKKGSIVIGDEFGTQCYNRDFASETNKAVNKTFIAGGSMNLIHCLIVPKPVSIDPYLRRERTELMTFSYYLIDDSDPPEVERYVLVYTRSSFIKILRTPKWEGYFWNHESLLKKFRPDGHFSLPDLPKEIERMKPGLYEEYLEKKKRFVAGLLDASFAIVEENKRGGSDAAERAEEIFQEIDEGDVERYIKEYRGKRYVDDSVVMLDYKVGRGIAKMVRQLLMDSGQV